MKALALLTAAALALLSVAASPTHHTARGKPRRRHRLLRKASAGDWGDRPLCRSLSYWATRGCLLLGVKRTPCRRPSMSASDPKRTSAAGSSLCGPACRPLSKMNLRGGLRFLDRHAGTLATMNEACKSSQHAWCALMSSVRHHTKTAS